MRKNICKLSLIAIIVLGITFPCFAQEYTIASLIEGAKDLDGQAIILEGEVIGDVMFRNDMAWLNVSDETGAIGVWINSNEAKKINITGNYKHQGDKIKINGIFYRALRDQGGEMAIAGNNLELSVNGKEIMHPIQSTRLIILVILGALTSIVYLMKQKVFNK